jgi:hypothetical protein
MLLASGAVVVSKDLAAGDRPREQSPTDGGVGDLFRAG